MSGTFRNYFGWVHTVGGRNYDFLDARNCENEVSTDGTRATGEDMLTVPVEDTLEVYNWTRDGDFEAFALQIIGEGYLTAEIVTDTPTSAEDLTASGTHAATYREDIANHLPFVKGSDQIYDSTLDANRKIYSITLRNTSEDDAVSVCRGIAN